MEKKLRITIPNEIYKIIESDLEDFGITKISCAIIFLKNQMDLSKCITINIMALKKLFSLI